MPLPFWRQGGAGGAGVAAPLARGLLSGGAQHGNSSGGASGGGCRVGALKWAWPGRVGRWGVHPRGGLPVVYINEQAGAPREGGEVGGLLYRG
jgi:hypothetical protein